VRLIPRLAAIVVFPSPGVAELFIFYKHHY
jgi:hypothetical protein